LWNALECDDALKGWKNRFLKSLQTVHLPEWYEYPKKSRLAVSSHSQRASTASMWPPVRRDRVWAPIEQESATGGSVAPNVRKSLVRMQSSLIQTDRYERALVGLGEPVWLKFQQPGGVRRREGQYRDEFLKVQSHP
jgi:hypothetical protein